jgi:hypothetical protein
MGPDEKQQDLCHSRNLPTDSLFSSLRICLEEHVEPDPVVSIIVTLFERYLSDRP